MVVYQTVEPVPLYTLPYGALFTLNPPKDDTRLFRLEKGEYVPQYCGYECVEIDGQNDYRLIAKDKLVYPW